MEMTSRFLIITDFMTRPNMLGRNSSYMHETYGLNIFDILFLILMPSSLIMRILATVLRVMRFFNMLNICR